MLPDPLRKTKDEIAVLANEVDVRRASLVAANSQLVAKLDEYDRLRGVSTFGFDYWPQHHGSDTLYDEWWLTLYPVVASDFDHMLSMGAAVVRILLFPQGSYDPGYQNPHGRPFRERYYQQTRNLVHLLKMADEREMKAIVAFANNYFDCGRPDETRIRNDDGQSRPLPHRWWMDDYPNSFADFLNDTREWIDGFVNAVEESAYKSAVLYYDFQNE